MKRLLFQIVSLVMAFQVLLVAHGLSVNFHLCAEDHHVMSSFGDASELCGHCIGHHHHGHHDLHEVEALEAEAHLDARCCCEDFDSEVGFTDGFTFSPEKNLTVFLPFTILANLVNSQEVENPCTFLRSFSQHKKAYLLTGRLKTIFFSNLKLNPLVF